MTVATAAVSITSSAFTAISAGEDTVAIICETGRVRVAVATSLPSASSNNWYPMDPYVPLRFEGMTTENVYAQSENTTGIVRVIKG